MRFSYAAALVVTVLLGGCKNAEEEYEPAILPKVHAFEGKVDAKYAGAWKSTDGTSALDLAPDGALKIETTTRSQSGKNTATVKGQWLASGDNLRFQYEDASKAKVVLEEKAALNGDTLVLQQTGGRMKTTYRRKP